MIDEETENQVEEVVEEAVEQTEHEETPVEEEPKVVEPKKEEEDIAEKNFRNLRKAKEQLEEEKEQLMEYIKTLKQNVPPAPPEEDLEFTIGDDDFAEGKHISKVNKRIKKLEQQLLQSQAVSQEIAIENRLKTQYPDFEKVVNPETLKQLREIDPELSDIIYSGQDLYKKALTAYRSIKRYGIAGSEINTMNKEAVKNNNSKPRPLASVSPQRGDSPISRVNAFENGLTEELKTQLLKEMQEAIKNNN